MNILYFGNAHILSYKNILDDIDDFKMIHSQTSNNQCITIDGELLKDDLFKKDKPYNIEGPISLYVYVLKDTDKKIYLFGDYHKFTDNPYCFDKIGIELTSPFGFDRDREIEKYRKEGRHIDIDKFLYNKIKKLETQNKQVDLFIENKYMYEGDKSSEEKAKHYLGIIRNTFKDCMSVDKKKCLTHFKSSRIHYTDFRHTSSSLYFLEQISQLCIKISEMKSKDEYKKWLGLISYLQIMFLFIDSEDNLLKFIDCYLSNDFVKCVGEIQNKNIAKVFNSEKSIYHFMKMNESFIYEKEFKDNKHKISKSMNKIDKKYSNIIKDSISKDFEMNKNKYKLKFKNINRFFSYMSVGGEVSDGAFNKRSELIKYADYYTTVSLRIVDYYVMSRLLYFTDERFRKDLSSS